MTFHALQKKATVGIAILACMAGFALPAAARKNSRNPAAVALFEKAIAASDIKAEGATAFRLQATIHIFNGLRQRTDGILVEFWAPGGKVRTEVLLPSYNLLKVSDGHHSWKKANDEYMPYPVLQLLQVMDFVRSMRTLLPPGPGKEPAKGSPEERDLEKIELGKPKKEKGTSGECVRTKTRYGSGLQFCFDPVAGHLTRILGEFGYEYGDYRAFGKESFPRSMHVLYRNGGEMAALQVTRIEPLGNPDPSLFVPVPGSEEEGADLKGCGLPAGKVPMAKLIKTSKPVYPVEAKKHGISGRVLIYAMVGKEGVPHALWVVESPALSLSAAALEAVQGWRYEPTTCPKSGKKIDFETVIEVIFKL
jgi:TonB family protein